MGPADWLQVAQNVVSIIQAGIQIAQTIMIKTLMENMVNGQWLLEQARKWGIYFDKLILQYSNLVYNYFVQKRSEKKNERKRTAIRSYE